MKLRISHTVDRATLRWATYKFALQGQRLSRKRVLEYLRSQVEMFGSDPESLMGSNWEEPDEYEDKDWEARFGLRRRVGTMKKGFDDIEARLASAEKAYMRQPVALTMRDAREIIHRLRDQLAATEKQLRVALRYSEVSPCSRRQKKSI